MNNKRTFHSSLKISQRNPELIMCMQAGLSFMTIVDCSESLCAGSWRINVTSMDGVHSENNYERFPSESCSLSGFGHHTQQGLSGDDSCWSHMASATSSQETGFHKGPQGTSRHIWSQLECRRQQKQGSFSCVWKAQSRKWVSKKHQVASIQDVCKRAYEQNHEVISETGREKNIKR